MAPSEVMLVASLSIKINPKLSQKSSKHLAIREENEVSNDL